MVNVSGGSAGLVLPLESTGLSVMVSLNVPGKVGASVTMGAVSAEPAAIAENAPNPELLNALSPVIAKLPARLSAGAGALLSTPRLTVTGALIVPSASV
jgi:hypothetical protein